MLARYIICYGRVSVTSRCPSYFVVTNFDVLVELAKLKSGLV